MRTATMRKWVAPGVLALTALLVPLTPIPGTAEAADDGRAPERRPTNCSSGKPTVR